MKIVVNELSVRCYRRMRNGAFVEVHDRGLRNEQVEVGSFKPVYFDNELKLVAVILGGPNKGLWIQADEQNRLPWRPVP